MRNREMFAVLPGKKQPAQCVLIVREAKTKLQSFPEASAQKKPES